MYICSRIVDYLSLTMEGFWFLKVSKESLVPGTSAWLVDEMKEVNHLMMELMRCFAEMASKGVRDIDEEMSTIFETYSKAVSGEQVHPKAIQPDRSKPVPGHKSVDDEKAGISDLQKDFEKFWCDLKEGDTEIEIARRAFIEQGQDTEKDLQSGWSEGLNVLESAAVNNFLKINDEVNWETLVYGSGSTMSLQGNPDSQVKDGPTEAKEILGGSQKQMKEPNTETVDEWPGSKKEREPTEYSLVDLSGTLRSTFHISFDERQRTFSMNESSKEKSDLDESGCNSEWLDIENSANSKALLSEAVSGTSQKVKAQSPVVNLDTVKNGTNEVDSDKILDEQPNAVKSSEKLESLTRIVDNVKCLDTLTQIKPCSMESKKSQSPKPLSERLKSKVSPDCEIIRIAPSPISLSKQKKTDQKADGTHLIHTGPGKPISVASSPRSASPLTSITRKPQASIFSLITKTALEIKANILFKHFWPSLQHGLTIPNLEEAALPTRLSPIKYLEEHETSLVKDPATTTGEITPGPCRDSLANLRSRRVKSRGSSLIPTLATSNLRTSRRSSIKTAEPRKLEERNTDSGLDRFSYTSRTSRYSGSHAKGLHVKAQRKNGKRSLDTAAISEGEGPRKRLNRNLQTKTHSWETSPQLKSQLLKQRKMDPEEFLTRLQSTIV